VLTFDPARLTFSDAGHRYHWDGQPVPYSATGVLKRARMYPGVEFMRDEHRDRGTAVHLGIEMALRGELDESSDWARECPTELAQVHAALRAIEDAGIEPCLIEVPVYYELWRVAGKIDLVGVLPTGYCVVDWKSGGAPGATELQLALYGACLKCPPRRFAIKLNPVDVIEYKAADFRRDLNDFGVCLRYLQIRDRLKLKD
jgi:hypothetical protein